MCKNMRELRVQLGWCNTANSDAQLQDDDLTVTCFTTQLPPTSFPNSYCQWDRT